MHIYRSLSFIFFCLFFSPSPSLPLSPPLSLSLPWLPPHLSLSVILFLFFTFSQTLSWLQSELPKHGFQFRTLLGPMTMSSRSKALADFQVQHVICFFYQISVQFYDITILFFTRLTTFPSNRLVLTYLPLINYLSLNSLSLLLTIYLSIYISHSLSSLYLSLRPSLFLNLSSSLFLFFHPLSSSISHLPSVCLSISFTLTLSLSLILPLSLPLSLYLSLSLTPPLSLSLSLCLSLSSHILYSI